jgi:hypothetical protein
MTRPTVTTDELDVGACRTGDLSALARLHLDVVADRANRHLLSNIALPGFTSVFSPATTVSPTFKALRRDDVGLFAVAILDQCDEGSAVGVVFQTLDRCRHIPLATLEVDEAVLLLVTAAMPREVTWPLLLRPPVLRLPSVSALTGLPFHSDDLSTSTRPRRAGLVGL